MEEIQANLAQFLHVLELQVPRMLDRETDLTPEFLNDRNPKLCVYEYFQEISPEIFTHSPNSLSCVDLIGSTCFQNILRILQNFPQIDTIKFWNISLDDYQHHHHPPLRPEDERLSIPNLETVEFGTDEPLPVTTSESIIIAFLTYSTRDLRIRTIKFSSQSDWLVSPIHNEVLKCYGDPVRPAVLSSFIIATAPTLEKLYCNRDQPFVVPAGEDADDLEEYQNIQLHHLSCRVSTTGIGHILKHQSLLGSLTFKSFSHIASTSLPCIFSAIERLASTIERCSPTLSRCKLCCIPLIQCTESLIHRLESCTTEERYARLASRKLKHLCKINLAIFQACTQLSYLKLKLNKLYLYPPGTSSDSVRLIFGTFLNGHLIPSTLRVIKINVNYVIPDELELLTSRFQDLRVLQKFILDSKTTFVITAEAFVNILQAPLDQLVVCAFKKGNLSLDFVPQVYLTSFHRQEGDGLHWELTVSSGMVKFQPAVGHVISTDDE